MNFPHPIVASNTRHKNTDPSSCGAALLLLQVGKIASKEVHSVSPSPRHQFSYPRQRLIPRITSVDSFDSSMQDEDDDDDDEQEYIELRDKRPFIKRASDLPPKKRIKLELRCRTVSLCSLDLPVTSPISPLQFGEGMRPIAPAPSLFTQSLPLPFATSATIVSPLARSSEVTVATDLYDNDSDATVQTSSEYSKELPTLPGIPKGDLAGSNHETSSSMEENESDHKLVDKKSDSTVKAVLRKKFSWKSFPELEAYLVEHRFRYLQYSRQLNYTAEQKRYNNSLTQGLLDLAAESGYVFEGFTFAAVRDRIRCYYKSYVQAVKKKKRKKRR